MIWVPLGGVNGTMITIQTTYKIVNNTIIGLQHENNIITRKHKHHHKKITFYDPTITTFRVNKTLHRVTGLNNHEGKRIRVFRRHKLINLQYKPKQCKWCKQVFTPTHSNHRYCSKQCRHYGDQYHTMIRVRRYRKRYAQVLRERLTSNRMGTGGLGAHACREFKEEFNKIRKEMRALGLNTVFSY